MGNLHGGVGVTVLMNLSAVLSASSSSSFSSLAPAEGTNNG